MAKLVTEDVIASLKEMTILEINELVEAIEEEFGVTAAAPMAAAVTEETATEEPTEVTVTLTESGQSKIPVIKVVREITGLGLMDAKKLVDALPATVKENISPEEADEIKTQLTEAGATVEVK